MNNKRVQIVTDGCSDIPDEWRTRYGIDYVPLTVMWNGEEKPATCEWADYSPKEFYDALRAGAVIKSNQVTREAFRDLFGKYVAEGCDIVYVACSSALSGTYPRARLRLAR